MAIYDAEQCAKIGYKAYFKKVNGLNHLGLPMPKYDSLPAGIKAAWIAATEAITAHFHKFLIAAERGK